MRIQLGSSVPPRFKDRLFYRHNANVTLMRTTPEENAQIGAGIARKLSAATGPVAVLRMQAIFQPGLTSIR